MPTKQRRTPVHAAYPWSYPRLRKLQIHLAARRLSPAARDRLERAEAYLTLRMVRG
jgi:hypothetical protein